jgi:hypothetical protein
MNKQLLQGIQCIVQYPHLGIFTHMELIWNVNFRFGGHKVKTTYIPSNQFQDFINEEHHNDIQQLRRNERGRLLFPCWDNYSEFSRIWIFTHLVSCKVTFFCKFKVSCTTLFSFTILSFLYMFYFLHNMSYFEFSCYKYNCSYGLDDKK